MVAEVEAALAGLAGLGWVVSGQPRSWGEGLEWELVRDPRTAPRDPSRAPIENYLVRLYPATGLLLFLHGNSDAGAFNLSMVAPLARVVALPDLEAIPGYAGGLRGILERLVRDCPPNGYGYT